MKKIKAYTILEVTIAMLLSAICISICYTAYGIIATYYGKFQQKNESTDAFFSVKQALSRDISKANVVLKVKEGILCQADSANISYLFKENYILRQVENGRVDTLKVAYTGLHIAFEGVEALESDTLDVIGFKVELPNQATIPLLFSKYYSATNLFH